LAFELDFAFDVEDVETFFVAGFDVRFRLAADAFEAAVVADDPLADDFADRVDLFRSAAALMAFAPRFPVARIVSRVRLIGLLPFADSFPTSAPATPPATAPTGPATIPPMTAPVMPPAVCLETEGRFSLLFGFLVMMDFSELGINNTGFTIGHELSRWRPALKLIGRPPNWHRTLATFVGSRKSRRRRTRRAIRGSK
jgi:hypothetical protein